MGGTGGFDARKEWLTCRLSPLSTWNVVGLVTELREQVSEHAPLAHDRDTRFEGLVAELGHRGIDADSVIRYGLLPEIMSPIVGVILSVQLTSPEEARESTRMDPAEFEAWTLALPRPAVVLDPASGDFARALGEAIHEVTAVLLTWVVDAPLTALVRRIAPRQRISASASPADLSLPADVIPRYRWLVDRFSTTFVQDWAHESVELEYRWLYGREAPPCDPALMGTRRVDRAELAEHIARATVFPAGSRSATAPIDSGGQLVQALREYAIKLLEQGRHREAASLIELAGLRHPDDPAVRNDLGFCLIPVKPREALNHLRLAAELGYPHPPITTYNMMCAHAAAGEYGEALAAAEAYWSRDPRPGDGMARLWRPLSGGNWNLVTVERVEPEIAHFAYDLARAGGWHTRTAAWLPRLRQPPDA